MLHLIMRTAKNIHRQPHLIQVSGMAMLESVKAPLPPLPPLTHLYMFLTCVLPPPLHKQNARTPKHTSANQQPPTKLHLIHVS